MPSLPHDTNPQSALASAEPKTDPAIHPRGAWRFPMPWGLFIALGVYAALVTLYIAHTYWSSPEYQAAVHYQEAWEILGRSEGRAVARERLIEAYEHLLEAARVRPELKQLHEELESLNWRFEERHWKLPEDLRARAKAVAVLWERIQQEQAPFLVVGARDRGWSAAELVEGPARTAKWSTLGGLVIVLIWGYGQHNAKRVRAREREELLVKGEREVEALGEFRRGLPEAQRPRRKP